MNEKGNKELVDAGQVNGGHRTQCSYDGEQNEEDAPQ